MATQWDQYFSIEVHPMAHQDDRPRKEQAVPRVLTPQQSGAPGARDLSIPQKTLYGWIAAYQADPVAPFVGSGA
jgi:transposase